MACASALRKCWVPWSTISAMGPVTKRPPACPVCNKVAVCAASVAPAWRASRNEGAHQGMPGIVPPSPRRGQGGAPPARASLVVEPTAGALALARFRTLRTLGQGSFGVAYLVSDLEAGRAETRVGEDWARAWSDAAGMPVVDARACCAAGSGHLVLPNDPGHLRAEGNLAAGRAAAPSVREALAGR